MKTPTTPFSVNVQKNIQIGRSFLLSEGWQMVEEKPLYERFEHTKNKDLTASIGLYGEFSVCELHWCNKTPERIFSTTNSSLTKEDYFKIW